MNQQKKRRYYKALLERDSKYDGLFYVGVVSTGVFCHASCPAKKPKFENCQFFATAKEALYASFRPCLRCKPLCPPRQLSPLIEKLIAAVEAEPERRWRGQDFRAIGVDESTARRQFKKRFGMTFVEYARARRMGLALSQIKAGDSVINSQLAVGYDSASGFRDAFSKILGEVPARLDGKVLYATWIDTTLGPMLSISDENYLYLLEFVDRRGLENEVKRLRARLKVGVIPGKTTISEVIEQELAGYFQGKSFEFSTPCFFLGSDFQKQVWQQLKLIPPGETCSYLDVATAVGRPQAYRAVANANGANQLALIIPCHRVINADGKLGGYGGGVSRKTWLLEHEKSSVTS